MYLVVVPFSVRSLSQNLASSPFKTRDKKQLPVIRPEFENLRGCFPPDLPIKNTGPSMLMSPSCFDPRARVRVRRVHIFQPKPPRGYKHAATPTSNNAQPRRV